MKEVLLRWHWTWGSVGSALGAATGCDVAEAEAASEKGQKVEEQEEQARSSRHRCCLAACRRVPVPWGALHLPEALFSSCSEL